MNKPMRDLFEKELKFSVYFWYELILILILCNSIAIGLTFLKFKNAFALNSATILNF